MSWMALGSTSRPSGGPGSRVWPVAGMEAARTRSHSRHGGRLVRSIENDPRWRRQGGQTFTAIRAGGPQVKEGAVAAFRASGALEVDRSLLGARRDVESPAAPSGCGLGELRSAALL